MRVTTFERSDRGRERGQTFRTRLEANGEGFPTRRVVFIDLHIPVEIDILGQRRRFHVDERTTDAIFGSMVN